ncbi:unnamed protein product [Paramecium pentaurelia]|uniref:Transmembrane protein n=1 Tax=Paramecium pentaurelia TaxID=43138 RepID=A0A8S1VGN8_9CILI|nr:unnamed protein product [Paramecium pentaurelia]
MYNYSLTRQQILRLEEKYYVLLPDNSKIQNSKVSDVIETQTNDPQLDQQTNSDYCDVKNSFNACQNFFLERFKCAMFGIIATFFLRLFFFDHFNKIFISKRRQIRISNQNAQYNKFNCIHFYYFLQHLYIPINQLGQLECYHAFQQLMSQFTIGPIQNKDTARGQQNYQ